jgi:hypothetical protein
MVQKIKNVSYANVVVSIKFFQVIQRRAISVVKIKMLWRVVGSVVVAPALMVCVAKKMK